MEKVRSTVEARAAELLILAPFLTPLRDAIASTHATLEALRPSTRAGSVQFATVERALGELEAITECLAQDLQSMAMLRLQPN